MAFFFNPFINIGGPSIDGKNHPLKKTANYILSQRITHDPRF